MKEIKNKYEKCTQKDPHNDHLVFSSWITDRNGTPVQHLQYQPFGESWIDQRNSSWNSTYTFYPEFIEGEFIEGEFIEGFSGKERDNESGYAYFGARYYDSDLSIWLSPDPLAELYPALSPYAYCANNPLKYIDPNGMEFEDFENFLNLNIDPPKKDNPQQPNSQDNPYIFPDEVVIEVPAPSKEPTSAPFPKSETSNANIISLPLITLGSFFVDVTAIISKAVIVIPFIPLAILMGGDTRPGQRDEYREHDSNKSPSKKNKHQEGKARKMQDRQGSKGEKLPPRRRPEGWRGPWPPMEKP